MAEEFRLPQSIFERLLKDRIIWLGSEVRDDNANEICAKMLMLAAEDTCSAQKRDPHHFCS
jgi:ATP-dependent Clp protease protease subunit